MQRTPVSSSDLRSVGYDAATNVLEIEFHNSSIYVYMGVPSSHYQGLMSAPSKGSYFATHIKKGGYPYRKIR